MACNERGMALVSVLLMLTVLLALAHISTEKVWQSTRQSADAANRAQLFWAAQAGIESARLELAASYASSGGWQSLLISAAPHAYPAAPAWVCEISGLPVEIYLRDNPDGDGDTRIDNDLKIFVLARARGRRGTEAMVESLCGFDLAVPADRAQPSLSAHASGTSLAELPVSTYSVAD